MLNDVNLIGRVGKDPEFKTINNITIAKFALATSKKFFDKKTNQKKEQTEWHNIVVFGKLAELVNKYCSKGRLIYVKGEIKYSNYDNKEGQKCYRTDINAKEILFMDTDKKTPHTDRDFSVESELAKDIEDLRSSTSEFDDCPF